jgi:hypothetical protein
MVFKILEATLIALPLATVNSAGNSWIEIFLTSHTTLKHSVAFWKPRQAITPTSMVAGLSLNSGF